MTVFTEAKLYNMCYYYVEYSNISFKEITLIIKSKFSLENQPFSIETITNYPMIVGNKIFLNGELCILIVTKMCLLQKLKGFLSTTNTLDTVPALIQLVLDSRLLKKSLG